MNNPKINIQSAFMPLCVGLFTVCISIADVNIPTQQTQTQMQAETTATEQETEQQQQAQIDAWQHDPMGGVVLDPIPTDDGNSEGEAQ